MKMNFWNALHRPFALNGVTSTALERNINFVRILFGIGLLHRYVDILGFSIISDNPDSVIFKALLGIGLSFLITIGFATPLALITLLFTIQKFVSYLGPQVSCILIWGLLLLGAGRYYSVDSLLFKNRYLKKLLGWVYFLSVNQGSRGQRHQALAQVRFAMILLFWGVCISAMSFHFLDPLWLQGKILQLLFTTPYLTDYYEFFSSFSTSMPGLYNSVCTIVLYIQGVWELLLLPLMYLRPAQTFVFVWGLGFFIQSFFMMNLGYLPFIEICMWIFVFNYAPVLRLNKGILYYDDRCNLCKNTVSTVKFFDFYDVLETIGLSAAPEEVRLQMSEEPQIILEIKGKLYIGYEAYRAMCTNLFPFLLLYPIALIGTIGNLGQNVYEFVARRRYQMFGTCEPFHYRSKIDDSLRNSNDAALQPTRLKRFLVMPTFLSLAIFLTFSFAVVNPGNPFHTLFGSWASHLQVNTYYRFSTSTFGQNSVDVFNKSDLQLGSTHLVLYETDEFGDIKRVAPFIDINGGRLDYLRNDLLYYTLSLRWQRAPIESKFNDGNPESPSDSTIALIHKVANLDACITGLKERQFYRARIFQKNMIQQGAFLGWTPAEPVSEVILPPINKSDFQDRFYCKYAFNLPPGHFMSDLRKTRTLEKLEEMEALSHHQ